MTTQKKAANVALLARVVMGWPSEVPNLSNTRGPYSFDNERRCWLLDLSKWDPYTSDADARWMLARFPYYVLTKTVNGHACSVSCGGPDFDSLTRLATELDAICAACLEWAQAQGENTLTVPRGSEGAS